MQHMAQWSGVTGFLDSNFFVAVVTLLAGLFAYFLYRRKQRDDKQDAANIILLEIKNAEAQLAQAKEIILRDRIVPESIFAMKTASWNKYGYLFVRDLSDEEWTLINTFYERCRQYDEVVEYSNTFFKKNEEQIRVNLHQALAGYTKQYLHELSLAYAMENEEAQAARVQAQAQEFSDKLEGFYRHFMSQVTSSDSNYLYRPGKAFNDAEVLVNTIRLDLSTSTVGINLGKIVK